MRLAAAAVALAGAAAAQRQPGTYLVQQYAARYIVPQPLQFYTHALAQPTAHIVQPQVQVVPAQPVQVIVPAQPAQVALPAQPAQVAVAVPQQQPQQQSQQQQQSVPQAAPATVPAPQQQPAVQQQPAAAAVPAVQQQAAVAAQPAPEQPAAEAAPAPQPAAAPQCQTPSAAEPTECGALTAKCITELTEDWFQDATAECVAAVPNPTWSSATAEQLLAMQPASAAAVRLGRDDCAGLGDEEGDFCSSGLGVACALQGGKQEFSQMTPNCLAQLPNETFSRLGPTQMKGLMKGEGAKALKPAQLAQLSTEGCMGLKIGELRGALCTAVPGTCWRAHKLGDVDLRDISCWASMEPELFGYVTAHAKNLCDVSHVHIEALTDRQRAAVPADMCRQRSCMRGKYAALFPQCSAPPPSPQRAAPATPVAGDTLPGDAQPAAAPAVAQPAVGTPAGAAGAGAKLVYTCCSTGTQPERAACLSAIDVEHIDFWSTPCVPQMQPADFASVVGRMRADALCSVPLGKWTVAATAEQRAALPAAICARNPCLGAADHAQLFPQCAAMRAAVARQLANSLQSQQQQQQQQAALPQQQQAAQPQLPASEPQPGAGGAARPRAPALQLYRKPVQHFVERRPTKLELPQRPQGGQAKGAFFFALACGSPFLLLLFVVRGRRGRDADPAHGGYDALA